MYRVVTKTLRYHNGEWRRQIDPGPWQPSQQQAQSWADYLRSTQIYDVVEVQASTASSELLERLDR